MPHIFIQIPVWTPPLPRVLNVNNQILDLNPAGNSDVGDMTKLMADSQRPEPDNATLTLMEVEYYKLFFIIFVRIKNI